jgi:predicted enzyme related to lactoylglutathione lyase
MVTEIAFFAYSVRDVPRARAFYGDLMGLRQGDSFTDHWVEFDVGNATFGVGNGESLGFEPGASTGAVFEVDDLPAMRERLKAAGAEVSELQEFPACSVCFARDPDGNRFGLHQRRPPVVENVA